MRPASPWALPLLISLAAALYLVGNGSVSLWDRDEPRYAQTSRQMLEGGDWVVPRFLDTVRTAKPVFIYWCQGTAMRLLGTQGEAGVFAARLPSAVAMTLVLVLVALAVRQSFGPAHAFWTVLVLGTSALAVWSAKACTTDAVLLVGITVAQLCLYQLWCGRATWPVVIAMAVAIGQAGLTKGPVVLGVMAMTLLALAAFGRVDAWLALRGGTGPPPEEPAPTLARRASLLRAGLKIVVAIAIIVLIVGPWLYLVARREATFLGTSVRRDVFTRVVTPLEGHSGPPGYHLALIFATFLPWSPLLPMAVVYGWKHRADRRLRFALAAVLGPWVMFELVSTKLPHYMLPAFPPLALLAADAIVRGLRGEIGDLARPAFTVGVAVMVAGVIGAMGVVPVVLAAWFDNPILPPVIMALATVGFGAVVLTALARQGRGAGMVATGAGMAAVYVVAFGVYLPRADALRVSARAADLLHRAGATGGAPGEAIMLDYKEPSLAFHQGGTIREESAMALSHHLLDRAPQWLVITQDVWRKTPPDVLARIEVLGSVRGLAYADGGRTVKVMLVRRH